MKKTALCLIAVCLPLGLAGCRRVETAPAGASRPDVSLVPRPLQLERQQGFFEVGPETRIYLDSGDPEMERVALDFSERFRLASGIGMPVIAGVPEDPHGNILFSRTNADDLAEEGYKLSVTNRVASCEAKTARGLFYGIQTIFQLLPAQIHAGKLVPDVRWTIPAVRIVDAPRYRWRGMMLDVSRHFFAKEFVKRYIDYLAMHKMNMFHWHLTDDQGWRVEIKRYPLLTETGAWRVDREDKHWREREPQADGEKATYGGFYTQDDIREVVAHAASRFITIVPEIEMPGHCTSALAAYPRYSCTGGPFRVPPGSLWPIMDVYCPGDEGTFEFLENVLSEVIELFPGRYFHIGGDEVDKTRWRACPRCQARIRAEGLAGEEELQSYFVKRIEKFLNSKNKKLIGWDEILEGGLAPNAAVMSWRGVEGGIAAARRNHDVVMSPTSNCYIDYYQGNPEHEPLAIGGYLPLSRVYAFEPTPRELSAGEAEHILGVQANLWTEYVPTNGHAEYMTFPRIAAVAEAGWSAEERRDWEDFKDRMTGQMENYEWAGINYAKSAHEVRVSAEPDPAGKSITVRLDTETSRPEIRYASDGRNLTASSPRYVKPLRVKKSSLIRAAAFSGAKMVGHAAEARFVVHRALAGTAALERPRSERYGGGGAPVLTDGLRGSTFQFDGRWLGYEGDDLEAVLDLGKPLKIRKLSAGFLQNAGSRIFLPASVEFAVSENGGDFRAAGTAVNDRPPLSAEKAVRDFAAEIPGLKARYIRVHAKNIGVCPEGHPSSGEKAWLLADEIIVE